MMTEVSAARIAGGAFFVFQPFDFEAMCTAGRKHIRAVLGASWWIFKSRLLADASANISLDELPRLHRRQNPDAWQLYAQEAGIELTNSAVSARYDLHLMLIEAALAGLGRRNAFLHDAWVGSRPITALHLHRRAVIQMAALVNHRPV